MRVVVQRVTKASLTVNGELVSSIGSGIVCLCGLRREDTKADLEWMSKKILNLRLWENNNKSWNANVVKQGFEVLLVSQATNQVSSMGSKDIKVIDLENTIDFHLAMEPNRAREMYSEFFQMVQNLYDPSKVKDGKFGEMMQVELVNDGPVTMELTTDNIEIPGRNPKPHPSLKIKNNATKKTSKQAHETPSTEIAPLNTRKE